MKKKLTSLILCGCMLFGMVAASIPITAYAVENVEDYIIEESDVPLKLYYDEEASHGVSKGYDDVDTSFGSGGSLIEAHPDDDWERWSVPLGNGYFGANVFGRTETERIQLTEKTLANPYRITSGSANTDGLNNFSETYIDFGHVNTGVSEYSRELDFYTAISSVSYKYDGVTYTREYFTSYPDKAMVIKLDASQTGKVDFVLRPTVPYEQEYMNAPGDRGGKTGTVTSTVSGGVGEIVLSGKLEYFDIDFVGLYKVYANGGTVSATTTTNKRGETDGTITVSGADSAYIVITMGTDYELVPEQFMNGTTSKPTFSTDIDDAMAKVRGYMGAIDTAVSGKGFDDAYTTLKARHLGDYSEIFGRVTLELDFDESDFALTTDQLLENYKNGSGSTYLEALYFQYGRYLLIASSRKGALPANLQGAWNRYNHAPWSAGYWHNVNVQMNYWPAFSTNISETFEAYVDYNKAYMSKAENGADSIIKQYNSSVLGQDGGNGWSIATGGYVNDVYGDSSIGNLGFTTQLFWEYYQYTQDETLLREVVYPVLVGAARFITKMVREDADGNYIAIYTDSPEQYVNGVWYYTDKGAGYAQQFAYQNNYNVLLAAKELGIDFADANHEDYAIIQRVLEQIDKYDPVRIGLSGQVKEFYEEEYYGDMGEYTHRHISQLVGLYPGNVINGNTPAWLDAAEYVLTERGDEATGWGVAHRLNLWARTQNGERAYDLLEQLLKSNTATNLWDLHPPFQIDGNLGGTSGISEMLLQSHAGYIEPLAAIPAAWANGSYTGLVARGNFEVSAAWADGTLTSLNVTSLAGGKASIKYGGIENATVCDLDGKIVNYTKNGDGVISFDTEAGETYIVFGFTKQTKPESVSGLTIEAEFLSKSTLTWSASSNAVAYNVYVAKESAADYTLLTTTKNTAYVYTPEELENARLTFAVTAVNAQGVESKRALVYRNPDDVSSNVDGVSASIVNEELQVAVKSNSYAGKYRLYSRKTATSDWVLVQESLYPIIIEKSYDSLLKYGVSVESLYGGESEITQISSYNNAPVTIDYDASNILSGTTFDPTPSAQTVVHTSAYDYQTLTDGSFNSTQGRFSTKTADSSFFDATVALPASFILGELRIFDFDAGDTYANNVGSSLKIEIYYDSVWTTVYDCKDTSEIVAHRTKNAAGTKYLSFDLTGHTAQMIRITAPSPVSGKSISIYEIECSGVIIPNSTPYNNNILLGKNFELTDQAKKHIHSSSGGPEVMTDGTLNVNTTGSTVFYTWGYNAERVPDLEFDASIRLGGEGILNKLRVYDQYGDANYGNSFGPHVIVQVRSGGEWITLHDVTITGGASNNIKQYRKSGTRPNSAVGTTEYWLEFDLGLVKADAVRIYLPEKTSGNYGVYEIECDGYYEDDGSKYSENLFAGREFVPTDAAAKVVWSPHTYDRLTDGVSDSNHRFSSSGTSSFFDATLGFGEYVASLETLTIDWGTWQQVRSGTGLVIQTLDKGVWKDVINITHDRAYQGKVTYELNGVSASAVRIYIPGVYPNAEGSILKGDCIAIMEISCTGIIRPADYIVDVKSDVFTGLDFTPTDTTAKNNIWGTNTYDKITDDGATNDSNSRFATANGHTADGTLDFGGQIAVLNTLTVNFDPYTKTRCGQDLNIYVYNEGKWTQVLNHVHSAPTLSETFDLGGVMAEKVRFTVSGKYSGGANGDGQTGDCIIIYEMSCSGAILTPTNAKLEKENCEDKGSNILLGTKSEQLSIENATSHTSAAVKDLTNAFDGDKTSTRYAVMDATGAYSLVIDLQDNIPLYTLSIYDWRGGETVTRSDKTKIELYVDGVWVAVTIDQPLTTAAAFTEFDLMGTVASKIRITFHNTNGNSRATIYEITCTTGSTSAIDRAPLLDAYKALESVDTLGDAAFEYMKMQKMEAVKELLMDVEADAEDVNEYVSTIANETAKLDIENLETTEYGDFESFNLGLSDDVAVNFYGAFASSVFDAFPNAGVVIKYADGAVEKHALDELPSDNLGRLILTLDLNASQMSDTLQIRVVFDDDNCGKQFNESIVKYAERVLNDTSYEQNNPGINELVKNMLNYGAFAQKYFNYNVENLANEGIYTEETNPVLNGDFSSAVAQNPIREGTVSGLTPAGWTLALESDVNVRFYFVTDNIHKYEFSVVKPDGNAYGLEAECYEKGIYRIKVMTDDASLIDDNYYLTIVNTEDGTSVTVTFSAMMYVNTILSGNASVTDSLYDLAAAIKLYCESANAYLGK